MSLDAISVIDFLQISVCLSSRSQRAISSMSCAALLYRLRFSRLETCHVYVSYGWQCGLKSLKVHRYACLSNHSGNPTNVLLVAGLRIAITLAYIPATMHLRVCRGHWSWTLWRLEVSFTLYFPVFVHRQPLKHPVPPKSFIVRLFRLYLLRQLVVNPFRPNFKMHFLEYCKRSKTQAYSLHSEWVTYHHLGSRRRRIY